MELGGWGWGSPLGPRLFVAFFPTPGPPFPPRSSPTPTGTPAALWGRRWEPRRGEDAPAAPRWVLWGCRPPPPNPCSRWGGGGGKLGILGGGRGAEAGAMRGGGGAEGGERGWGSRVGGRGGNGAQRGGGAAVRCRDKGHPLPPPPSVSLWGGTRGGPQRVGGRGPPGGDGAQWRRWAAVGCGETGRPRLLLGVRRDGDGDGDGGRPTNTGGGGKTFLLGGSGALNPGKPLVWESASSAALRSAAASAAPPGLTFLS